MSTAPPRARSLAWLERPADNRKVASPNLAGPTFGPPKSCGLGTRPEELVPARGVESPESLNPSWLIVPAMSRMPRGSLVVIVALLGIVVVAAVVLNSYGPRSSPSGNSPGGNPPGGNPPPVPGRQGQGTNLNAELRRSGNAVLVPDFCAVSEFARDAWTGCP